MKRGSPINRIHPRLLFTLGLFFAYAAVHGVELDPFPGDGLSRDPFSISFFREERPSFYWVNVGLPNAFFNNVQQNSLGPPPNPIVYSIRSIEYGLKTDGWPTDQLQLRASIPFEANALVDPNANTQNAFKFGDLQVGATYLLEGKREKGNYLAVDGWWRFPTGTNPFTTAYPLLATGKGATSAALGVLLCQEVGGFSFFQSVHYEKTQSILVGGSNPIFGAGTFEWPDYLHASVRGEWLAFHRAQRLVSLYYELRMRMSGLMEFNHQAIPYGSPYGWGVPTRTTDILFFSTGGLEVRVDKEFSAEGQVTWFPFETFFTTQVYRPDYNFLFSLSLTFRPL